MSDLDMTKPVTVTLDGIPVHTCNTVLEAEEWMVDDPSTDKDRVAAGDYQVSADEAAIKAYAAAGQGETTASPDDEPLNDVGALRGMVAKMIAVLEGPGVEALVYDEVAEAVEEAQRLLGTVPASDRHPWLQTFDEITTAGRIELVEFIDSGAKAAEEIDPTGILAGIADGTATDTPDRKRPMLREDVLRLMRGKAGNLTHALGVAPLYFAIPGMRNLISELHEATMVPAVEDFDADAQRAMLPFVVTYDEWKLEGKRTVPVAEIEAALATRRAEKG